MLLYQLGAAKLYARSTAVAPKRTANYATWPYPRFLGDPSYADEACHQLIQRVGMVRQQ
jgi:hypothetical protein